MNFDNEEDDIFGFNPDELAEKQAQYDRIYGLPVMVKAKDILDLIEAVCASMNDEIDARIDVTKFTIRVEGLDLVAFIERAECRKTYSDKMECAVAARFQIRNIIENLDVSSKYNYIIQDYINVLREAIDEFKPLFATWVKSFDKSDIQDDGWGLWV
jgi:hypothetical protein